MQQEITADANIEVAGTVSDGTLMWQGENRRIIKWHGETIGTTWSDGKNWKAMFMGRLPEVFADEISAKFWLVEQLHAWKAVILAEAAARAALAKATGQ